MNQPALAVPLGRELRRNTYHVECRRRFGWRLPVALKRVGLAGAARQAGRALDAIAARYGLQGPVRWKDTIDNLVVNEGLTDSLEKYFNGSGYTAAWYVGLTDGTPTVAAGDTMSSHAGWAEVAAYDEATRPAYQTATAASQQVTNTANKASFSINADSTTIGGAFIAANNTKSGTSGVLYGAGAFTGGDKAADSGDTLNVTVVASAAAS